jgi:hypothetical protein
MPENKGRMPPFDRVDIILRNGEIRRYVKPIDWRWKPWDFESEWDIMRYQKSLTEKNNK